jgi:hypothetical protein
MIATALLAAQLIALPDAIAGELKASCAEWTLAAVLPEVDAEIRSRTPSWPANLIPGDFNGDGQTDVAVLVDCRGMVQLFAFVSRGPAFTRHALTQPEPLDPRQFLHLIRGDFEHDAIGVEFVAIGGHAWVLRDGRWRSVVQ